MTVDVKNKIEVSEAAEKVRREFGNVTMLFNNAGIVGPVGKCWETDSSNQELTIQVNFMSHIHTLQEFLPWMVQNNRLHVIATCSTFGYCHANNFAPYVASKHAVLGYYNCLKEDLRAACSSVRVSLVCPGVIKTKILVPFGSYLKSISLPILAQGISASCAGRQIIDGVVRNKENIDVPWPYGLMHAVSGLLVSEVYSSLLDFVGSYKLDIPQSSRKSLGLDLD